MNLTERQNRIVEYLRIKPITHGQVYTSQIAIPESQTGEIPSQKCEALKNSLVEQGSNLFPLIVRRTEAYSEEEEYEVVYGTDWCIVARELDIEKLWVWVFDMTDEQAVATKAQMEQLVSSTGETPSLKTKEEVKNLLLELENSSQDLEKTVDQRIANINEQIKAISEKLFGNPPPKKTNLLTAKQKEVCDVLKQEKVSIKAVDAAWKAVEYWKKAGELTWENLEKSTKARGEHKINGFAKGTYQKLKEVAEIRN